MSSDKKSWHPENLRRGRRYLFHIGDGGTMETVQMLFDDIHIESRTLMIRGRDMLTKQPTALAVRSILEYQVAN